MTTWIYFDILFTDFFFCLVYHLDTRSKRFDFVIPLHAYPGGSQGSGRLPSFARLWPRIQEALCQDQEQLGICDREGSAVKLGKPHSIRFHSGGALILTEINILMIVKRKMKIVHLMLLEIKKPSEIKLNSASFFCKYPFFKIKVYRS